MLNENKLKATFFVNGQNFDSITSRGDELKQMLDGGHQIGSHTFSHPDLSKISADEVRTEMTKLDNELATLIGMKPTYMRPPFFSTDDEALQVLGQMQYHVINADIDTKDFEKTTPETNDEAFENFKREFGNGGTISLMHDVHNTTVNQLIPNVINFLNGPGKGKQSMTVGECLGDAPANWYRTGSGGGNGTGKAGEPAPDGQNSKMEKLKENMQEKIQNQQEKSKGRLEAKIGQMEKFREQVGEALKGKTEGKPKGQSMGMEESKGMEESMAESMSKPMA
ncbi:polysaccharide deacetylase domain-containing protein [Hirsutella rhossiliensis]|uniref:Polysaccharide deacetylase domain-containing protein n=1 Tax=Hirsutella rhossiliensis TaxID=111463 RepID=A0A9P8N1G3_9HYPO|nr:polysaccharide deacetylase domain-containing protein [Hirsutella rhossiliensis]KAH0966443.1 polysaccharide deacetylase domain-containing protein [Hirsutella rhossiliensis]